MTCKSELCQNVRRHSFRSKTFKTRKKCRFRIIVGRDLLVSEKCFLMLSFVLIINTAVMVLAETTDSSTFAPDMVLSTALPLDQANYTTTSKTVRLKNFMDSLKPHQRLLMAVEHAGEPRSLHVEPLLTEYNTLQLNVTWKPPKGSRLPDYYTMVVISQNSTNICRTKLCYVPSINGSSQWSLVPEIISSADGAECDINPGCTYAINLKAHPWNGKSNLTAEYTVPDCVASKCNCEHKYNIDSPSVSGTFVNESFINITWSYFNTSSVDHDLSHYIFRIYDRVMSLPIKALVNEVIEHRAGFETASKLVNIANSTMAKGKSYVVRVAGIDARQCNWPEGKYIIKMPDEVFKDPKTTRIFQILIVIMALMIVTCLAVSLSRCRVCRWLKEILAPKVIGMHSASNGHIRRQEAWPGESAVSFAPDVRMTEERNPLYVMKNTNDNRFRGETDAWEVSPRRLKLLKVVGEGNFGVVYLAKLDLKNHDFVAVKKLKAQPTSDEVNDFLGEIRMLKLVGRHPHVVSLVGCCTLEQPYYALLEYASGGNLHQKLVSLRESWLIRMRTLSKGYSESSSCYQHHGDDSMRPRTSVAETEYTTLSEGEIPYGGRRDNSISIDLPRLGEGNTGSSIGSDAFTDSEDFTISDFKMSPLKQGNHITPGRNLSVEMFLDSKTLHRYALQIAKGMEHLEANEIVHRDLAARNVLIDDRGNLKVSDLGLSRQGIYVPLKQNALPLRWLALEAIRDFYFSSKSDVWSFAVVLWEIGTLAGFPYQSIHNEGVKHYLSSGGRLERPEVVAPSLYEIMLQCWDEDPERRPNFSDLVQYLEGDDNKNKTYINLSILRRDYVFPPTEQLSTMTENRLKLLANTSKVT